jgi:uncharacterized protein YyaL (SSP411 family)
MKTTKESVAGDLDTECLGVAMKYYIRRFDPENGGFGSAPKFPTPVNLEFLLHLSKLNPDFLSPDEINAAKQMVLVTLQKMALGGIHGRYSVQKLR